MRQGTLGLWLLTSWGGGCGYVGSAASQALQQAANTLNSISLGNFTGNYSQVGPVLTLNYNYTSQSASQSISLAPNVACSNCWAMFTPFIQFSLSV